MGTHEVQVLEGEADLHKHVISCQKNPGHKQFIPVNKFNVNHLPEGYHDINIVELIKATADLTVRVDVQMASSERPQFWKNTNHPYPFFDKRESNILRLGTGMIWHAHKLTENVIKEYNMGTCPCHKCQHSDTPSIVWGEIRMNTATHVVFDQLEARQTTCRLFYDKQDSPLVTLKGWTMVGANIDEDLCELKCVTCDLVLLDKLEQSVRNWDVFWEKVNSIYRGFRDVDKLVFIVSHPHGYTKQISVGQWVNRYTESAYRTKYSYTASTCPGSSGAYIHILGFNDWLYYSHHVHSCVNSDGKNLSGAGRERFS